MALREIAAHFGFTFDAGKLGQIDKGVEGVKHHTESAASSFTSLAEGIKGAIAGLATGIFVEYTNHIREQAAELQDLTEQTGLATEDLQAWSLAAELGGASAQDFTNGLRKLSKELATGVDESGQQSKLFKQLHIDTKNADGSVRDLSAVLPDIAERFKGLKSGAEKSALAQQIFGRSGTKLVPILSQGAAGVAQLKKQLDDLGGGFSKEAIENADAYDDSLIKLNYSFFGLKSLLATAVFPLLADVVTTVTKGVVQFRGWLKETTALQTAVKALAFIVGRSLLLALAPFILPGLKFLAIFLAVDDLIGFLEGKDSEIGHILTEWFGEDTTNDIRAFFNSMKEIASGTLAGIADLWRMLTASTEAEHDKASASFLRSTEAMSAAIDNWFNYVGLIIGNVVLAFHTAITNIEVAWNQMIFGISQSLARVSSAAANAFKDTLGIDTKDAYGRQLAAEDTLKTLRSNIEDNKDRVANNGNAINAKVGYGPVKAPTAQTNYVEINAPVQVTLPPGVTGTQARELTRQAAVGAQQGQMRSALQSLEQR